MDCRGNIEMVRIYCYGWCQVVDRKTVLQDLDYQYEGTDYDAGYDIYSNEDGDYFAVREDDNNE